MPVALCQPETDGGRGCEIEGALRRKCSRRTSRNLALPCVTVRIVQSGSLVAVCGSFGAEGPCEQRWKNCSATVAAERFSFENTS